MTDPTEATARAPSEDGPKEAGKREPEAEGIVPEAPVSDTPPPEASATEAAESREDD